MKITNWKETIVTSFSMLVTGYLNAHTQVRMGTFVGPQTGNLANLGINLARGNHEITIRNILIFLGFILGCAFGTMIERKIKNERVFFFVAWSTLVVPMMIHLIFHQELPMLLSVSILSMVSGMALGFFRKIAHVDMNNLIVTGSMRNISMSGVDTFVHKDKKKLSTFAIIILGVFLFFLGAFLFGLAEQFGDASILVVGTILAFIPYFFAPSLAQESIEELPNNVLSHK